jgi:hypothetical protein
MKIGYEKTHNFEINILLRHKSHKISLGWNLEVICDG